MPATQTENYTAEMTKDIVSAYQSAGTDKTVEGHKARADVVKQKADQYGKSERSIRSKLVTQKVYIKKAEKSTVTGDTPEKKDAIAVNVVNAFGVEMIPDTDGNMKAHRLSADSLAKMNKTDLAILFHRFNSEIVDEIDALEASEDENDSQEGEAEAES